MDAARKLSPVRILIVDDDEDDFFILKEYISNIEEREFIIDWCQAYGQALDHIKNASYHLYFIDYRLGADTGLQLIQDSIKNNCEEPLILLTGNGNRLIDMQAMESGAVDYLVKGELNTEKLERSIRYALERTSFLKVLSTNEKKFRNIFERSRDIVFIADEQLKFLEVNNASVSILGYDKCELLSKNLYELLTNRTDADSISRQLGEEGQVTDKETEVLARGGERKPCVITLSRETNTDGTFHIQGIIHDITSLKKAEKAATMLEKLNMANRLTRIMAHEVRNPLSNIMLAAEQVKPFLDNSDFSNDCIDIINRNSKRIDNLISELLNSLRSEPLTMEKKPLQAILDDALDAAMDRLNLQHIELQKNYLTEPAWITANAAKLKIAFLNIIINAIEAMEKDKGRLLLSVEKKNTQYVITIADNGSGISEENMQRLFEPYFTSKRNGMGLGLASALNILQSHNATYDVQSKENKGTTFSLFFNMA